MRGFREYLYTYCDNSGCQGARECRNGSDVAGKGERPVEAWLVHICTSKRSAPLI